MKPFDCESRPLLYILDDHDMPIPVPPEDALAWAEWHRAHPINHHVGDNYLEVGIPPVTSRVSTIFLGVDFSFVGPPLLFETRVFGGDLDGEQVRYTTRLEAIHGHRAMCQRVRDRRLTP